MGVPSDRPAELAAVHAAVWSRVWAGRTGGLPAPRRPLLLPPLAPPGRCSCCGRCGRLLFPRYTGPKKSWAGKNSSASHPHCGGCARGAPAPAWRPEGALRFRAAVERVAAWGWAPSEGRGAAGVGGWVVGAHSDRVGEQSGWQGPGGPGCTLSGQETWARGAARTTRASARGRTWKGPGKGPQAGPPRPMPRLTQSAPPLTAR